MTQAQTIPMHRHPYADGGLKRMLIDGQWVDAVSGKTFESRNPATGELLATVAEGDHEDIDKAAKRLLGDTPEAEKGAKKAKDLLKRFLEK